ncbi:MAG: hypothetical protein JNK82_20775 [Myxococcaceae bacterium]|nr:hypothetical protein [Myxococcaceae bacterium]
MTLSRISVLCFVLAACQTGPQPKKASEAPPRPELGKAYACLPTCYAPETSPPPGCQGDVTCESRGSLGALALNVVSQRLTEATKASAAKDAKTCEAASRSILLGVRGYQRAAATSRSRGDFITKDGQRWTEAAATNALADLAAEAASLITVCGGSRETTATDELAFYVTGSSAAPEKNDAPSSERGIGFTLEGSSRVCPGTEPTFNALLELEGGVKRRASRAEVRWSVDVGAVDDGIYRAPLDAASLLGPSPTLRAQHDSGREASMKLQFDFRCPRLVNASGQSGVRGAVGEPATETPPTSLNIEKPKSMKHARELYAKHFGQPGKPGGAGGPAGEVHVYVAAVTGAQAPLALVRVVSENGTVVHVVDPAGPALVVDASGGKGGAGGDGGEGARGQSGEDASVTTRRSYGHTGGFGGPGGDGARGGQGGAGGRVTVHYDKKHPELQTVVKVLNDGGAGGEGGAAGPGGAGGLGGFGSMGIDGFRRRSGLDGDDGTRGPAGHAGRKGPDGPRGPRPSFIAEDASRMFAAEVGKGVVLR